MYDTQHCTMTENLVECERGETQTSPRNTTNQIHELTKQLSYKFTLGNREPFEKLIILKLVMKFPHLEQKFHYCVYKNLPAVPD
jgi:hypothetical protein